MTPDLRGVLRSLLALLTFAGAVCASAHAEQPLQATVCQLKNDPANYNHQLVEVTAFVSHDFEDFSLFDPGCSSLYDIWLEYGGTVTSGTTYCCSGGGNSRTRAHQLEIENVPIPLVENDEYRQFDKLIQPPFRSDNHGSIVHATIVGRFFAGRKDRFRGDRWSGYGHMGCCSLLAIEEIRSVDPQDRSDLDYGASPDQPQIDKNSCGKSRYVVSPVPNFEHVIQAQRLADLGENGRAFNSPERVAAGALATDLRISEQSVQDVKAIRVAQGRIVYELKASDQALRYMVVLSRPYWLAFYSKDANKVAWVVIAAYAVCE